MEIQGQKKLLLSRNNIIILNTRYMHIKKIIKGQYIKKEREKSHAANIQQTPHFFNKQQQGIVTTGKYPASLSHFHNVFKRCKYCELVGL